MLAGNPKPPKRGRISRQRIVELREESFSEQFQRVEHLFPGHARAHHIPIVQRALESVTIDWPKINPSIEFLERFQNERNELNRRLQRMIHAQARNKQPFLPEAMKRLQTIDHGTQFLKKLLDRIKSRRTQEQN